MPRPRPDRFLVVVAVLGVLLGVLVLRSPGARDVGVDPYAPATEHDWLDTLSAWNGTRGAGAVLVLAGLAAAVFVVGLRLAARAPHLSTRPLLVGAGSAAVLVAGGLTVLGHSPEPVVEYVGTYKLLREPPPPVHTVLATVVWTRTQTLAALAAAAGLLLASGTAGAAVGRRRSRSDVEGHGRPELG